jgi:Na+-transporting NADH:ubiquinone oxidoreductase subunit C
MSLNKDSYANTFIVATVLCLVCSFLVSTAAVGLKPFKERNIALDRKKNILQVTGFTKDDIKSAGGADELFEQRLTATIIDLDTGEEAIDECKTALETAGKKIGDDVLNNYDQFWASRSKKPSVSKKLEKKQDIVGIKYREKYSHVFTLKDADGKIEKYVFPVRGYGLWSMMQGYLAVEPDFQTVAGLTFYEQGETPGLGGEVLNPKWKSKWPGKQIFEDGEVSLKVSKGDQTNNEYGVDALSGATITSNGVSKMMKYWMGPDGFGPFIDRQKSAAPPSASPIQASTDGGTNG